MLTRYRRHGRDVEALLFDGSPEAATEICTRFSGVDNQEACVAVPTSFGQVFAGAGCWVVQDCRTRALRVIDDREFTAQFEMIDDAIEATMGSGNVFADLGLPDADRLLADSRRRIEAERAGLPVVRLGGH